MRVQNASGGAKLIHAAIDFTEWVRLPHGFTVTSAAVPGVFDGGCRGVSDVRNTVHIHEFHGCLSGSQALFFYTMMYDVWEARFWDLPWTDARPEGKGHRTTRFAGQSCPFTGERAKFTGQRRPLVKFLRRDRENSCIVYVQSVREPNCLDPSHTERTCSVPGGMAGQRRLQTGPHPAVPPCSIATAAQILISGEVSDGDCHSRLKEI